MWFSYFELINQSKIMLKCQLQFFLSENGVKIEECVKKTQRKDAEMQNFRRKRILMILSITNRKYFYKKYNDQIGFYAVKVTQFSKCQNPN